MLEKLSKMSVRQAMIEVAGKPPAYGEQPRWLSELAKKIGLSYRTARSIWFEEIRDPGHWAIKAVRREAELVAARKEAAELARQYQAIAGGMRADNQNLFSAEIDRLERIARIIGGLDRA